MTYRLPARAVEAIIRRQDDGETWTPDAVLPSKFDRRYTVTQHPVESGLSVTDHVQPQPATIRLTCVVTETPATGSGGPVRVRDRLAWLNTTAAEGRLVDLVTRRHGVFTGYALAGITFGVDNVSRLQFDLELTEVRVATVSTITVDVETVTDEVAVGAPDEVDLGEQATTSTTADTTTEQEAESDTSLLASLIDAL
jgi:hypothetical protein